MPPYRIRINCLDCNWIRQGWSVQTLTKADKHSLVKGHTLEYWRLTGKAPANYLGTIKPLSPESW